jgi:glutamate 5-kinase
MIRSVAEQIASLTDEGRRVVLVSSGAIGSGLATLGLKKRPGTLPSLQAAASVGQAKLIGLYDQFLARRGYHAAQILLTRSDFEDRVRYLNASNTIHALFDLKAVPVINENDSVSVDEIKFGDNDLLSAFVTNMVRAELLVMLTTAEGLYDTREGRSKGVVAVVEAVDSDVLGLATSARSAGGSGGMRSKLEALRTVSTAGVPAVIAGGKTAGVLTRLFAGEELGTLFLPAAKRLRSSKRWIGFTARARGGVRIDAGAREALGRGGASLLPVGVLAVEGEFEAGDVISIRDEEGCEVARGLTNLSSSEVAQVKGMRTPKVRSVLGTGAYNVVVHCDNMTVLPAGRGGT